MRGRGQTCPFPFARRLRFRRAGYHLTINLSNEADTCRRYVLLKLYEAGCTDDQINEQKYFTDGRIVRSKVEIES